MKCIFNEFLFYFWEKSVLYSFNWVILHFFAEKTSVNSLVLDSSAPLGQMRTSRQPINLYCATHPITLRSTVWDYMVQVEAPSTLSVRKVCQVPSGHQREEHRVVHHVKEEHYDGHIQ